MSVRLTDTAIGSAVKRSAETGKRIELTDATLAGLRLRLTPAGARSWVLACRDGLGAMRRFPLGQYPGMGIADARGAARAMREEVRKGADPVADARRKRLIGKQAKEGIGTLAALIVLYEREKGGKLKSWAEMRRRIEGVFAAHLSHPLATLNAADLKLTAAAHPSESSASAAVRYIRPVLRWGAEQGYVEASVAALKPRATVGQRKVTLSNAQLRAVLPVLRASDRPYAAAMLLMMWTLARREEVCAARWRDMDWQAGTLTLPETKNGTAHVVPLPSQAIDFLRARMPKKIDPDALIFATSTGARLSNWDRATKAIHEGSGTSGWQRHDLRRTGATMLGGLGIDPHVVEAALNHTSIHSKLAAGYNQARYRPQVAAALQTLADALDGIEAEAANAAAVAACA